VTSDASVDAERRPLALGRDEAVVVDDEIVVWREHGIHRLNATAALVWARCDGETDLDALVHALAAEFDTPVPTVRRDVLTAVDELAARGLVTETVLAPPIPMIEPPIECTGCGDGPAFGARVLLAVDEGLLGVGVDRELAPELAAAFGPTAMGVIEAGRTSYGVLLPAPGAGSVQDVAGLYRGPDLLARARHPEPVVEALIAQVGAHCVPAGGVLLEAVAVGRNGRVALVAPPANPVAFERAAARQGLATAPGTAVVVAPGGRTVLTGAPWLDVDRDRIARAVRDRAHTGDALPTLAAGEHEIVALGASVPSVATAFGELAPAVSFAVGDGPLRSVAALGTVVPIVVADDLEAISRTTGAAPAG
jgi:Coenzyme PQQ synthesis protein D (PqqD)